MSFRLTLGLVVLAGTAATLAACVSDWDIRNTAQSAMPPPDSMRNERGGLPLPYGPRRVADASTPAPMYTPQYRYDPPAAPTASPTVSTAPSPDTSFRPQAQPAPNPGPTYSPGPPPIVSPTPSPRP